jgi:hypothetical protein
MEFEPPRLRADSTTNQNLRIPEAFAQLAEEGRTLQGIVAEHVHLFPERVSDHVPTQIPWSLLQAAQIAGPVRAAVDADDLLRVDFRQERWGLEPLAHAKAAASLARSASETVDELLCGWSDDRQLVASYSLGVSRRTPEQVLRGRGQRKFGISPAPKGLLEARGGFYGQRARLCHSQAAPQVRSCPYGPRFEPAGASAGREDRPLGANPD